MRLAIVGSRHFNVTNTRQLILNSWHLICHVLGEPEIIVTGCARGVDQAARELATVLTGLPACVHRAQWTKLGKAAGPTRNTLLAKDVDAGVVFWDGCSPGSRDVLSKLAHYTTGNVIEFILTEAP